MPSLKCPTCLKNYALEQPFITCPICRGKLNVVYDYEEVRGKVSRDTLRSRGFNLWRYYEVLPVLPSWRIVSLGEGGTYLHRSFKLAERLRVKELYVKDETTNPTGSFLDRGASVLVTRALWLKAETLTCASAGNLGASLAAYAAKAGIKCIVYAPSKLDLGKLYQMTAYGADLRLTKDLEEADMKARMENTGYLASSIDPFFLEGVKITAWEICDQLNWDAPDVLVIPMGSGGHLSMAWKALKEMEVLGIIDRAKTRIIGVQPEGCAPIVKSFKEGKSEVEPIDKAETGILDIGMKEPPYGNEALKAMKESRGAAIAVSDQEALEAMKLLARLEGVFSEPAASSTVAGLLKLLSEGEIDRGEKIVCIITGEGLKDPKAVLSLAEDKLKVGSFIVSIKPHSKLGKAKLEILKILSNGTLHGYGLRALLEKERGISLKLPSLYQHLEELKELGFIREAGVEVVKGRWRRLYDLTEKGRKLLEGMSEV